MAYCQKCGAEMKGAFCTKCGAASNNQTAKNPVKVAAAPQQNVNPVYGHPVRENTKIRARYSGLAIFFASMGATLIGLLWWVDPAHFHYEYLWLALAFFVPGLIGILLYTPVKELPVTLLVFFLKGMLCIASWVVTVAGIVLIIGIILCIWKLGVACSTVRDRDYTAIVDGKRIGVTRMLDTQFAGAGQVRFIYADKEGNLYRSKLR